MKIAVDNIIGKIINVIVDRPIGSVHPSYPNLHYRTNYGYVKGIDAPDGEEQDAYIIGVSDPVKEYTGKVIAVIHRLDDIEDKWVVVPLDSTFSKEEVLKQVNFQEQFFHIEIIM